jgi:mono/diheme cytochrome c family protein
MNTGDTGSRTDRRGRAREGTKGLLLALFGLALVVASIFWIGSRGAGILSNDPLVRGQQLYDRNCAACHGPNGEGHAVVQEAPALDSSEHAWHHPDGHLQRLILDGGENMPAYRERLSERDVANIIRYFQTWWTEEQLEIQRSLSASDPLQE